MSLISIVIPVYNEEFIIEEKIDGLIKYLEKNNLQAEIIIVNNQSNDNTATILQLLKSKYQIIKICFATRGIGNALREGFVAAKGDYVMFTAMDFPFGYKMIEASKNALEKENIDLVIGSKAHHDSQIFISKKRIIISYFFRLFIKVILNLPVKDPQGSFFFRRRILADVLQYSTSENAFFQTQFVLYTYYLGYKIKEIPVYYENIRNDTRFNIWRESMLVGKSLLSERQRLSKFRVALYKNDCEGSESHETKQKIAYDYASINYEHKMQYTFTGEINQIVRQESVRILCPQKGDVILDVGTGDGAIAIMLSQKGAIVTAFDISPKMVELGKKRISKLGINVNFYAGDAQNIVEADASFDSVLCSNVIHRLPSPDKCLSGVYRVLKNNGKLVIFTMNLYSPQFLLILLYSRLRDLLRIPLPDTVAKNGYTPSGFRELLKKQGFDIKYLKTDVFSFPYFNIYCPKFIQQILVCLDSIISLIPGLNKMGVFIKIEARKRVLATHRT